MTIEFTTKLIIQSVNGDSERGGWQATAGFANNQEDAVYGRRVNLSVLPEGNGLWDPNYRTVLTGTIMPRSLTWDRGQSNTQVLITTSDEYLRNAGLQGIYFTNQASPSNPHQINGLTLGKIVEHLVEGHTNMSTEVGGWVDTSGIDTDTSSPVDVYTVRQNNSIWAAIEKIAQNEFYVRYFTKDDRFIYERHPQFKGTVPEVTFHITQNYIIGQPEITYRSDVRTDQVQLYALTDQGEILTANYPANVGTDARRHKINGVRCNSQSRLDTLSERAYKFLNREIDVKVTIPGVWGCYLELYDRIAVTYTGTSRNGVTIDWTAKKFWIKRVTINRQGNFGAYTELDLEEENIA